MKIIHHSPTLLTLQLRPWFLWLFGAAFSTAGLVVILLLGNVTTLTCQRTGTTGDCKLSQSGVLDSSLQRLPLNEVRGAEIATHHNRDGNTYQIRLLTDTGEIPLTSYYSSGYSSKANVVQQIEQFVSNPEISSLSIQEDGRWFAYPFGGVFLLSGLAIATCFGQVVTCSFDKTMGKFTIQRQGLLGNHQRHYRIQDISNVEIEESRGNNSSTYRVSLVIYDDSSDGYQRSKNYHQMVPLTTYYSSGYNEKQKTVDSIRNFLDLSEKY